MIRWLSSTLNLIEDELLTFYAILLTSDNSTVPGRRLLRSEDDDVGNTAVKDAMWRNRFDEMMSCVHVVDDMDITADPFFFDHLNDIKAIPTAEHVAVDEMMIEYFGRHGCSLFEGNPFVLSKTMELGIFLWICPSDETSKTRLSTTTTSSPPSL
uniref:PiggyBac transposable element-derived protein domain-containing protein n=1 Tax=Knipowitschia caucasica TaxID=637954 RepID=A0AAV2JG78_KNICA